ncbi:MAG: hypothetical protein GC154_21455 [bacterium]|nr:hypothetical protein [bacterium]
MSKFIRSLVTVLAILLLIFQPAASQPDAQTRISRVASMKGLIAFWDFSHSENGLWTSFHDDEVTDRAFPVYLRRIGDPKRYTPLNWPYRDDTSALNFDSTGPFGAGVCFNQGYIYAEVPRESFERTPLNVHGESPFTLITWLKFTGKRHMIAGIWDEGGWDKYRGRRQFALFGGLFGSGGVIGHLSATGAASFPQSNANGSQYARLRAIDGRDFHDNQWVSAALTFEPGSDRAFVYLNGVAAPSSITDPVEQDVYHYDDPVSSNPYSFKWPLYSPRAFLIKYNGYDFQSGVYEHWLRVDLDAARVTYGQERSPAAPDNALYRVRLDIQRDRSSLLGDPIVIESSRERSVDLPASLDVMPGDEIVTSLFHKDGEDWSPVGTEIHSPIREGAPFTFGRALGLGAENIDHGSQLILDGVAVLNRVLTSAELEAISFTLE